MHYELERTWKETVVTYFKELPLNFLMNEVKGKGKVVRVLSWAPRHEGVLGECRYSSTHSLTSALDGGEWSASRPGCFNSTERAPDTHWTGGWVDPRAVMDAVVKRKIPSPCRESNPRTPINQPVNQGYTDWAIPAPFRNEENLENCDSGQAASDQTFEPRTSLILSRGGTHSVTCTSPPHWWKMDFLF
jgi:hypothetical protein